MPNAMTHVSAVIAQSAHSIPWFHARRVCTSRKGSLYRSPQPHQNGEKCECLDPCWSHLLRFWCTKHQHVCLAAQSCDDDRCVQSMEPHHLLRLQASSWARLTCLSAVRAPQCAGRMGRIGKGKIGMPKPKKARPKEGLRTPTVTTTAEEAGPSSPSSQRTA